MKKILYIDMDGVIADFEQAIKEICPDLETSDNFPDFESRSEKVDEIVANNPQIFQTLKPINDAINSVNRLFEFFDVYFLSTPMWAIPESYMGKRIWIENHFKEKGKKRLILSHRKDLLIGHYLIDDRLKNGASEFKGEHIHFGSDKFKNWSDVMAYLESEK